MQKKNALLIKYQLPTRYDRAPYNTLCTVIIDEKEETPTFFVQISNNEEKPKWIEIGELLKGAHLSSLTNDQQRNDWIENYKENHPT